MLGVPPEAVTKTVMVLAPTDKGIAVEAAPEATAFPFTVTVDVEVATVGVTLIDVVALATETA